jgi:hypothetical protein
LTRPIRLAEFYGFCCAEARGGCFEITPQQDGRMDDTSEPTGTPTRNDFKSRPGALVWFFHKSRDGWKRKYQELKATVKGYKNRIADLTKSREQWRLKAEQAAAQLAASETEIAALRAQIAASEEKKKPIRGADR